MLFAILLGLVALDAVSGDFDLARARSWFELILPWIPLFLVLIGPRVAVVAWFAAFAVVLGLGADPLQVSGTVLPTMLLLGLSAFVFVWRASVMFTAGVFAMLAIAVAINPTGLGLGGAFTFATLMLLAAAAGYGLSLLRTRLERSARREAELRAQQERVRAEERTRLAYELHDIVANQVTLIAMQARRAEFADPGKTSEILEHIGDAAGQTLQDLRSLVLLLKSESGDAAASGEAEDGTPLGGTDAQATTMPEDLADEFERVVRALEEAGFTVDAQLEGPVDGASASVRQILGRTLRELGTNALKHADPSGPIELRMAFGEGGVTLSASNRISAKAPIFSTGTGLEAMRARCEVFGGSLSTGAADGRWTTSVALPPARPLALQAPDQLP